MTCSWAIFLVSMSLRRRRQKKGSAIKSFLLLLILLGGAGALVWKFFYTPTGIEKKADIQAEEGVRALVRIGESQNFVEIPTVGTLWEGESLASREDAGISLTFFEKSTLILDENSQVTLNKMRQGSNDQSEQIEISLDAGRAYFSVEQKINPRSEFFITEKDLRLETHGGELLLSSDSLIVLEGRVQVFSQDRFLETVEFGQEFERDTQKKKRIPSTFSKPTWIPVEKENPLTEGAIDIEDDVVSLETPREIEPPKKGIILTSPGQNGETIEILEEPTLIKGKVPEGTRKVMVNGYTLGKFSLGDREFRYNASREFGTLKEGSNIYNIIAVGEEGEEWKTTLTLIFDESIALSAETDLSEEIKEKEGEQGEQKEEKSEEEEDSTPVTGSLTITSPKTGDSFTEDIIIVKGTAPSNAVKITVDDYALSLFKKGDTDWKYTIKDAFGNREVGKKKIVVKAYDAKKKLLGTKSITITLEELPKKEKTPASLPVGNVIPRGDYLPPVPANEDGSPTI